MANFAPIAMGFRPLSWHFMRLEYKQNRLLLNTVTFNNCVELDGI